MNNRRNSLIIVLVIELIAIITLAIILFAVILPNIAKTTDKKDSDISKEIEKPKSDPNPTPTPNPDPEPVPAPEIKNLTCDQEFSYGETTINKLTSHYVFTYKDGKLTRMTGSETKYRSVEITDAELEETKLRLEEHNRGIDYQKSEIVRIDKNTYQYNFIANITPEFAQKTNISYYQTYESAKEYMLKRKYTCE